MKKNKTIYGFLTLLLAAFLGLQVNAQTSCPGFKTFTQGGWGSKPSGSNPGTFLNANFAANFPAPTYLTVGCTNKLQLTSAAAVRAFLPNGTTPAVLPAGTSVNKTKTNFSNVLAGQLVALTLNLRFDNNIASFGSSTTNLKDLVIASGPFIGKTVQFLADNANMIIGGCPGFFPKTLSEYTTAIDNVNKNYDNGTNTRSFLACPLVLSCSTSPVLCFGASTGSMTVSTSGGLAPFTYTWTNAVAGNVPTANNLPAGTYTVTVSDASGQVKSTFCTITQPTLLVASASTGTILCNGGTTTVDVSATGGTAPYTGTGSFTVGAGSYTYTVTDANNCSKQVSVEVSEPSLLIPSASSGTILCNGGTTEVTVTATGGTAPYTGTGSFTVGAGSYTYTVTDANNCSKQVSVEVSEPTVLVASDEHTNVICYEGSTGSLSISIDGGTSPYSVSFNGGDYVSATSPADYSDLTAGSYTWSVKDANGCKANGTTSIEQPETAITATTNVTDCSDCTEGTCNGIVEVLVEGGVAPYSYAWTINEESSSETSSVLQSICAGSMVGVLISDANGCYTVNGAETTAIYVEISCITTECGQHKTFTQGGWGAMPNGNNPGVYLHANFDEAYQSGLTIGCGSNTLSFYSAQSITDFLPEGGTPNALPTLSVLTGQLLAAELNIGFDAYDANFGNSGVALGAMYTDANGFEGLTVSEIVAIANQVIGGCSSDYSFASLNSVLTIINENFDNGTQDNGHLICYYTPSNSVARLIANSTNDVNSTVQTSEIYPNPAVSNATFNVIGNAGDNVTVSLYDLTGRVLFTQNSTLSEGVTPMNINVDGIAAQQCVVRILIGNQVISKMLSVQH